MQQIVFGQGFMWCNIPPVKSLELPTTLSRSLRCEAVAEHQTAEQHSKKGRTKLQNIPNRSDRSWGYFHYTKPLSCSSRDTVEMTCKSHLSIKCHIQYAQVIRLLQNSPIQSKWLWLGWIVFVLQTITVVLNLIPQKSHHSLNSIEVKIQELCNCYSHTKGWTRALKVESSA